MVTVAPQAVREKCGTTLVQGCPYVSSQNIPLIVPKKYLGSLELPREGEWHLSTELSSPVSIIGPSGGYQGIPSCRERNVVPL